MATYSFQNGNGFYHIDRTLASNLSALPSNAIFQYTGQLVGIANSNPQYPLDVSGDIHSSGNMLCGGSTLSFVGSNPQPGYGCLLQCNPAGELSVAGYTSSNSPAQRKVVVYDNLNVANALTLQNNPNGTYQAITINGSNGNMLQVGAAYTSGAFSAFAAPGDFVIRSYNPTIFLPTGTKKNGSILLQVGPNGANISITEDYNLYNYVSVNAYQFNVSSTSISITGNTTITGNLSITGNLTVSGTINGKTI